MSELENKAQEQETKKRPYNLRDKKPKDAAYRSLIRPELADELYDKILNIIVVQKKYRDPNYSAKDLAKELQTNTRYLSAVVNSRFGMNYSCLLNEYRIREACRRLADAEHYGNVTIQAIYEQLGYSSASGFINAFRNVNGMTPSAYMKLARQGAVGKE